MNSRLLLATLTATVMALPATGSAATLTVTFGSGTPLSCTIASAMSVALGGNVSVSCAEASPIDATTEPPPPPPPPPEEPPPPTTDCNTTTGVGCLGQLENGTWVAADRAGLGTLYIPSKAAPTTIIWDTVMAESFLPGCGGLTTNVTYNTCTLGFSLRPGVTYGLRLPFRSSALAANRLQFTPSVTRDQLGVYRFWIASTPGGAALAQTPCSGTDVSKPLYYKQDTVKSSFLDPAACALGAGSLYYIQFRPDGVNASKCGTSLTCQMRTFDANFPMNYYWP